MSNSLLSLSLLGVALLCVGWQAAVGQDIGYLNDQDDQKFAGMGLPRRRALHEDRNVAQANTMIKQALQDALVKDIIKNNGGSTKRGLKDNIAKAKTMIKQALQDAFVKDIMKDNGVSVKRGLEDAEGPEGSKVQRKKRLLIGLGSLLLSSLFS